MIAWFLMRPGVISRNISFVWFSYISFYLQLICWSHSLDASFILWPVRVRTLPRRFYLGFDIQISNQGTSCTERCCISPFHQLSWNSTLRYQRRAWQSGNSVWFGGWYQKIYYSRPRRQSYLRLSSNKLSFSPVFPYFKRGEIFYRFFIFLRSSCPVGISFYAPSMGFYCRILIFFNAIYTKTPFTWRLWGLNLVERAISKIQWCTFFRLPSLPCFLSIYKRLLRKTGWVLLL